MMQSGGECVCTHTRTHVQGGQVDLCYIERPKAPPSICLISGSYLISCFLLLHDYENGLWST